MAEPEREMDRTSKQLVRRNHFRNQSEAYPGNGPGEMKLHAIGIARKGGAFEIKTISQREDMPRELIGKANHIHSEDEIASLDVYTIEPDVEDHGIEPFVTVDNEYDSSIVINSLEQWEQLNALVRKAFDGLSK